MNPETIIRMWFDDLWTQGKEETIDRLMAPDALVHDLPGTEAGPMQGRDAFKPFFRKFRGAFPDMRVEVVRTIAAGDLVAAQCRVTGTHSANALGIEATGKRVEFTGMTIARVQGDQIVEGWNCFDFLALYKQMGLLSELAV
jgi:steroid delta-isomerase-like uncharacterized protein